jgi:DNA invertase Pin-like site-specific DNA recombinase
MSYGGRFEMTKDKKIRATTNLTMEPPTLHLAAIYRRVSTDHQDNSLAVQEALNDEYCRRLQLPTVTEPYEDEDVSGSIPFVERSGGKALITRLRHGDVRHLITAKQDRLGRDTLDTIGTIRQIWEMGITPHFTAEGGTFPRTPQNELLFEIKASVAQYERNLIRERTRAVLRHKFERGELTGKVPFGYDCVYTFADGSSLTSSRALNPKELAAHGEVTGKRLSENPAERASIRDIFNLRASGWSLKRIAEYLNAGGSLPKLGGLWQCGNVDSILRSRHAAKVLGGNEWQTELTLKHP